MAQELFQYGSSKKRNPGDYWTGSGKSIFESAPRRSRAEIEEEEKQQRIKEQKDAAKKQEKPKTLADLGRGLKNVAGKAFKYTLGEGSEHMPSLVTAVPRALNLAGNLNTKDRAIYKTGGKTENRKASGKDAWESTFMQRNVNLRPVVDEEYDKAKAEKEFGKAAHEKADFWKKQQEKGVKLENPELANYDHQLKSFWNGKNADKRFNNSLTEFAADPTLLLSGGVKAGTKALSYATRKVAGETAAKTLADLTGKIKNKIPGVKADEGGLNIKSMSEVDAAQKRAALKDDATKKLLDSNAPVKALTQHIESALGRKLRKDEDPYELMKLRGGVEGQAATHLQETAGWMADIPEDLRKDGDLYGYAKQYLSQANKRTFEQLERAQKQLEILDKKYGGDLSVLEDYSQKMQQTSHSIVDLYESEGMITKEVAEKLKADPDYYAKMEVLQDENSKLLRNGGTVSVRENSALKGIKGHKNDAALAHSSEAYVKQTINATHDVANNRVGRAMGALADELGDNGPVMRLRSTDNVLGRNEIYSELKKTKEHRDALTTLKRDHKGAIRALEGELRKLKAKGMDVMKSKEKDVRNAIIKGANDGADLPGNGSKMAKLPKSQDDIEQILDAWIKSDKSGLKGIVDRLAKKDQRIADMKSDLETIEGSLSRVLTGRKELWDKAQKLRDADIPEGYSRISYMDNGVRNEVAVPKEIGDILTGADRQTFDIVTRTFGKIHNIFRQAVTTYNPLFTFFRNPIRDFKSFSMNSRYVPVHRALDQYAAGMFDSIVEASPMLQKVFPNSGQWTKEFIKSGGGQAGYFSREGGQYGKQIKKAADQITKKRSLAVRIVTSPKDFMETMASAIEQAPRVAEYKNAVQKGASNVEAAIAGREVTVDFAQGGSLARVANQWIPFLNARTQGVRRTAQAFKENPKRAITVWAATGAAPIAALAAWNSQFADVWKDIQDYEKESNFIFITGKNEDGSAKYFKVPKGDVDKILGNTFETMLDQFFQQGGDPATALRKSLIGGVSNLSPVSFANGGDVSTSSVLSGTLPPAIKTPVEWAANKSFFKDAPIISGSMEGAPNNEQFNDSTPELARLLGNVTGQSPMKVDNTIKNLAGNVPYDIANAATLNPASAQNLRKGVVGTGDNKIETEFWKVFSPAKQTKDYRERQIYSLIDEGKYKEAQRKADDYNRDVDGRFTGYFRNYGHSMPDQFQSGSDPYEMIDSLKIDIQVSKKGRPYIKR